MELLEKLIDLELQVFGNQDLWRHIKSFTFDERKGNQLCEFCKKTKTSKFIYEKTAFIIGGENECSTGSPIKP